MVEAVRHGHDAEFDLLTQDRTQLVHIPRGADSELFGGWGIRI